MDLTALLLRVAARRPHVLVVAVPGAADVRLAVEAALTRRGWPVATGPADSDVLAVAGSPGPELAAVVARLWEQVPAPRAQIEVSAPAGVDERLDAAAALLGHVGQQRIPSAAHPATGADEQRDHAERGNHPVHGEHVSHGEHAEHGDHPGHPRDQGEHRDHGRRGGHGEQRDQTEQSSHAGHGEHADHGEHGEHTDQGGHGEHSDHGAAAGGHAGHGGGHHDHHGHGGMVAGLPMAELGADRDGLMLDRLHVPLGPVLPDWPAGLVVRVTLQGDVIQEASAEVLDAGLAAPFEWPSAAARELDGLARFLGVAGWPSVAGRARGLRNALLAGSPVDQVAAGAAGLLRRIRRSRTLRWLIRGIPAGSTDVATLLAARLAAIDATLSDQALPGDPRPGVEELAGLLVGAELAAARLIVAAVDPDTDRVPAEEAARHG